MGIASKQPDASQLRRRTRAAAQIKGSRHNRKQLGRTIGTTEATVVNPGGTVKAVAGKATSQLWMEITPFCVKGSSGRPVSRATARLVSIVDVTSRGPVGYHNVHLGIGPRVRNA